MNIVGRNEPCPCGSGRRYKECHGSLAAPELPVVMSEAVALQRQGRFEDSALAYLRALAIDSSNADALHMLGVVRLQQGRGADAVPLIMRALEINRWKNEDFRHNLGLAVAECMAPDADAARREGGERAVMSRREQPRGRAEPTVAVVIPCYNHARYVSQALRSVFAQTRAASELVVIDDGSTDASADVVRKALAESPVPHRFIARENRGATHTINEAVAMTSADFVNILNSDDCFSPERIATMVKRTVESGADWAFSSVSCIDDDGNAARGERARSVEEAAAIAGLRATAGFGFIGANVAISSGNIFFSRQLFDRIGGFRNLHYNHDWDFCLRALRIAEPAYSPAPTYRYRLHGMNTIRAAQSGGGKQEADAILREYISWALHTDSAVNRVAPTTAAWGAYFLQVVLAAGLAHLLEVDQLRSLAGSVAARDAPSHAIG